MNVMYISVVLKMFNLGCLILLTLLFNISESHYQIKYGTDSIPKYLWDCYKSGLKTLPMTDKIFIDIIRKIEKNSYFSLDIRLLTNSMLHRFWRDGIEQDPKRNEILDGVLPFGPSGFQANKYKLLIEKLIPGSAYFFPNNSITLEEQCTLHFMLSSSVWAWERGDESQVCPESSTEQKQRNYFEKTGSKRSSCPIEKGVIRVQKDGITSLSHVIAAIATTLAPLQIKQLYISEGNGTYGDSIIDNRWAATLAGDLAEIIIIQSPHTNNLFLGPGGRWNDTIIPNEYYMIANEKIIENGFWQCTDAELFGSLDGLAMSEEVSRWLDIFHTLKLSQILELYYTHYGAYFQIQNRACNRRSYYMNSLINQRNTITEQVLLSCNNDCQP